jgi:hypothetical protein
MFENNLTPKYITNKKGNCLLIDKHNNTFFFTHVSYSGYNWRCSKLKCKARAVVKSDSTFEDELKETVAFYNVHSHVKKTSLPDIFLVRDESDGTSSSEGWKIKSKNSINLRQFRRIKICPNNSATTSKLNSSTTSSLTR